ncbi:MAG: hypothetical protein EOP01_04470 [Propionibacteriaceae bacterium]|nr:MAG: hypothetical protein EOP01_04470 [Propionibacteriaceae bacterium]
MRRHATKGETVQEFGEAEMRSWWRDRDPPRGVAERVIGADSALEDTVHMVLSDCGWLDCPRTAG